MKIIYHKSPLRGLVVLLILSCTVFYACEQEDIADIDESQVLGDPNSLYNQINDNEQLSVFRDAAVKGGFALRLREGDDNLTVFAPSNEAFAASGINLDNLDQNTLERILAYHVLQDSLPAAQLSSGRYQTASGKFIEINTQNGVVIEPDNEAAQVVTADIGGTNGVLHIIDKVLIAPDELAQLVSNNSDLSILAEAVGRFPELGSALEGFESELTVFAPTNAAFESFLEAFPQYSSLEDVPDHVLRTLLEYHLVESELFSGELNGTVATLQGEEIETSNVLPSVNDADVNASNGVVHIIDQVLVPPSVAVLPGTVLGTAYFDPEARFTTLFEAIEKAGLRETLLAEGPYTVFAPTNEAFETADFDLDDYEAEDPALQSVLLYHVIAGSELAAADLTEGPVSAANELSFYVNLTNEGNFVNAAEIILADVDANNGIIHAIDKPLMPPVGTVVETALNDDSFSILARALEIAGLSETLGGEGPYTVFAPTDAAFTDLFNALGVASIEELSADVLRPILLYHVTAGRVFSFQVDEGVEIQTLNTEEDFIINETVFPQPDDEPDVVEISIVQPGEDSELINTNIVATNGIIHVIDKVLLP
ncbi:MAG: fasciclin domain-containing protein [Cyclobacteriaceae bacterium]